MSEYQVGDRVRLKPCSSWNQPYRGMAEKGRLATITAIGPAEWKWDRIFITFDVLRKGAAPRTLRCNPSDLIPAGDPQ